LVGRLMFESDQTGRLETEKLGKLSFGGELLGNRLNIPFLNDKNFVINTFQHVKNSFIHNTFPPSSYRVPYPK
jgi:hypothetical protein